MLPNILLPTGVGQIGKGLNCVRKNKKNKEEAEVLRGLYLTSVENSRGGTRFHFPSKPERHFLRFIRLKRSEP